ncbi:MAG: serine hydrolase [Myxococcota bacterium]|nr:serine hydrolase [Myxococcota bacterium]
MTFSVRRPWRIVWIAALLFACEAKVGSLLDLPSAPSDQSASGLSDRALPESPDRARPAEDPDRAAPEEPDRAAPEDARISEDQRSEDAAQLADQALPRCDEESDCAPGFLCDDGDCVLGECLVDEDCQNDNLCDGLERCEEGSCVSGEPLRCVSESSCLESRCAPELGCVESALPPETLCDDGRAETVGDHCTAGVCSGCILPRENEDEPAQRGWGVWTNRSVEALRDVLPDGFRMQEIDVVSVEPLRISVTGVANEGEDARAEWWWYVGINQARLDALIEMHDAELIDLDVYRAGEENRFAVILASRAPGERRSWWYAFGSSDFVQREAARRDARITELDTYRQGGEDRYAALMIENTGEAQRSWWFEEGRRSSELLELARERGARITSIVGLEGGRLSAILEESETPWWFYTRLEREEVLQRLKRNGARPEDLNSYQVAGELRYALTMVNNLGAAGFRIGQHLRALVSGGTLGAFVKSLSRGEVLTSWNSRDLFEPASSIKTLHHFVALQEIAAGRLSFEDELPFCDEITGRSCPRSNAECGSLERAPLRTLLTDMMTISSNTATQALREQLGEALINERAAALGMHDTLLRHRIGCGDDPPGDAGLNSAGNRLTLQDISRLHEEVYRGVLGDEGLRDEFWDIMSNGRSFIEGIIDEEGAEVGLDGAQITLFKSEVYNARKGGSYTSRGRTYRSGTGFARLPYRCGPIEIPQHYTFGLFVHDADSLSDDFSTWESTGELLREAIRAALLSWRE